MVNLGSHLGRPYQLTAKFVHSAVEGFRFVGVPGCCVLIYRSKVSQDSHKVWEIHSQTPGRGGGGMTRGSGHFGSLSASVPKLPPPSHARFFPPSPHAQRGSPIREEAVYNAIPQGVHSQRPDLLQVHAAGKVVQNG